MEEVKSGPVLGIKDYIVSSRQKGYLDSDIITALNKGSWPQDIIKQAIESANVIIPPLAEKISDPQNTPATQPVSNTPNSDVFTSPPIGIEKKEPAPEQKAKIPKPFTFLALIALLLSPIPFIGLGVGMSVFEYAKKNNKSGGILALLAVLINFIIILFLVFILYQILTLDPNQLTGFSRFVSEKFNLI